MLLRYGLLSALFALNLSNTSCMEIKNNKDPLCDSALKFPNTSSVEIKEIEDPSSDSDLKLPNASCVEIKDIEDPSSDVEIKEIEDPSSDSDLKLPNTSFVEIKDIEDLSRQSDDFQNNGKDNKFIWKQQREKKVKNRRERRLIIESRKEANFDRKMKTKEKKH